MDFNELKLAVDEGLSIHKLADRFNRSPTNIRYWLKKHGLKTNAISANSKKETSTHRWCPACDSWKAFDDFYTSKRHKSGRQRLSGWCKICSNQAALLRQQELKQQAVTYKGGSCEDCGYSRCLAALEFHHLDPAEKDPSWTAMKMWGFDRVKPELDKCALLCANCHRERHYSSSQV